MIPLSNEGPWATAQGTSLTITEAMGSGIHGLPGVGKIVSYDQAVAAIGDVDEAGEYSFQAGMVGTIEWEVITDEENNTITRLVVHK